MDNYDLWVFTGKLKCSREAMDLFWYMTRAGVGPDDFTMVSEISACTNLSDVEL